MAHAAVVKLARSQSCAQNRRYTHLTNLMFKNFFMWSENWSLQKFVLLNDVIISYVHRTPLFLQTHLLCSFGFPLSEHQGPRNLLCILFLLSGWFVWRIDNRKTFQQVDHWYMVHGGISKLNFMRTNFSCSACPAFKGCWWKCESSPPALFSPQQPPGSPC